MSLAADTGLVALFQIPESEWTTINRRVGLTRRMCVIEDQIERYLPKFPALAEACEVWASHTFSWCNGLAGEVETSSHRAVGDLREIDTMVSSLPRGQKLSPTSDADVKTKLTRLSEDSKQVARKCGDIAGDIISFVAVNREADADYAPYQARMGSGWQELQQQNDALENACGLLRGSWQAFADDVGRIASAREPLTTDLLFRLEIGKAAQSWSNLGIKAAAFGNVFRGQERYLSGAYLDDPS